MEYHLDFKPLIKSPYCQTILGTSLNFNWEIPSKTHYIKLKDNDLLAVEVSTPKDWNEDSWTFFLVHGLCGSHKSHYMRRIAKKFNKLGYQAVRINLRNCGSGRGLSRGIYHSGSSDDVLEAIQEISRLFPNSKKGLIGFSLGGNIVLKLLGELGPQAPGIVDQVIAVGAPVDLLASARLFMHPKNQIYAKYFLRMLLSDVNFIHSHFSDLPPHNLPPTVSINDFDELYVAPRANFASALDYYYYCSSKRVIKNITVPAKILFSEDDPIINSKVLNGMKLPSNIQIYKTLHGGHIGFMGQNIFKEFRWMDNQVVTWALEQAKMVEDR